MKKISISADMERRLKAGPNTEQAILLVGEIVKLLEEQDAKRAAGPNPKQGLGYKELVALFRFALGRDLALPPSPSTSYIVRVVNKARDQGINETNVDQIVRGLRRAYPRGPYGLDFIVGRANVHYLAGGDAAESEDDKHRPAGVLYTGRPVADDE